MPILGCSTVVLPHSNANFAGTYHDMHAPCNGWPQYHKPGGKYMHHYPANVWRLTNGECKSGGYGSGYGGDTPVGSWSLKGETVEAYCAGSYTMFDVMFDVFIWQINSHWLVCNKYYKKQCSLA